MWYSCENGLTIGTMGSEKPELGGVIIVALLLGNGYIDTYVRNIYSIP